MADLLDRSLKVLFRLAAPAFLRLAGLSVDPSRIRIGDVTINLAEHRADGFVFVGDEGDPKRWAAHVEFQSQPDSRVLTTWFLKNAVLTSQLQMRVLLIVLYLLRGDRATFPDSYFAAAGGISNEYRFHAIRLWEHAEAIRSGELAELAPLLLLCEDKPSEETIEEERALIRDLDAPREVKADLLAVAAMIGTRYFTAEVLQRLFREELMMLKEAGFIQEWIEEGIEEGIEKGRAEGIEKGRAEGRAEGARELLLQQLAVRFGELPAAVVQRIGELSVEECQQIGLRLLTASSLDELGLTRGASSGNGSVS